MHKRHVTLALVLCAIFAGSFYMFDQRLTEGAVALLILAAFLVMRELVFIRVDRDIH